MMIMQEERNIWEVAGKWLYSDVVSQNAGFGGMMILQDPPLPIKVKDTKVRYSCRVDVLGFGGGVLI